MINEQLWNQIKAIFKDFKINSQEIWKKKKKNKRGYYQVFKNYKDTELKQNCISKYIDRWINGKKENPERDPNTCRNTVSKGRNKSKQRWHFNSGAQCWDNLLATALTLLYQHKYQTDQIF